MAKQDRYLLKLISDRLKEIRNQLALTPTQFSNNCGITYAQYSRFERGDGGSIDIFFKITNYIAEQDYNINWLMLEDNSAENLKSEEMFFFSFNRKATIKKLNKATDIINKVKKDLEIE